MARINGRPLVLHMLSAEPDGLEYVSNTLSEVIQRQEGKHGKIFQFCGLDFIATSFSSPDSVLGRGRLSNINDSEYLCLFPE